MNKIDSQITQALRGWFIVICGALFYLYQFMIRVSPNIMSEEIMTSLAIDASALGLIAGIYYWGYTAMQLPLGITMDRLGPRIFLCSAAFLCAFACFLFGNTNNFVIAALARFLMGMGSACGLIGTIKLGTTWLPRRHVAKVTAITILFGTAGAGLAGTPLKYILIHYGVERTMEFLAILGVVVGCIIYFVVHNHPKITHKNDLPDIYANNHPLNDILLLVKTRQAWIIALYGMLMYVPIATIGDQWGVAFVERSCHISEKLAASVVSTMFLGAAMGSPVFAFFSDSIKSRKIPMLLGSLITGCLWVLILFKPGLPLWLMYGLFFTVGFAYTAKVLTFASICEIMPSNISGISIAFVNMVVMSTGIIFHPIIGYLIEYHWNGAVSDGIPYYNYLDFRFALSLIPMSLGLSSIMVYFLRETHLESSVVKEYGTIIDTDIL